MFAYSLSRLNEPFDTGYMKKARTDANMGCACSVEDKQKTVAREFAHLCSCRTVNLLFKVQNCMIVSG